MIGTQGGKRSIETLWKSFLAFELDHMGLSPDEFRVLFHVPSTLDQVRTGVGSALRAREPSDIIARCTATPFPSASTRLCN